jgi:hypothetical protein
MQRVRQLVRFFYASRVVPASMVAGFSLIVAAGGVVTMRDPPDAGRALGPLLLLQLFAAASGFHIPARRGYFDLPLSCGHGRLRLAVVHCAMSIGPGVASWLVLGLTELAASQGTSLVVFSSGSCAALLIVSLLAWGLTVPFTRLTGGLAWLATLAAVVTLGPAAGRAAITAALLGADPPLPGPGLVLLCPWVSVGRALGPADLVAVAPAVVVALGAATAAGVWIWRADVPLEAAQ